MFRLIRLGIYAFVAYFLYELFQDVSARMQGAGGQSGKDLEQALNRDIGRKQTITGPGRGTVVSSEEASGESVPHVVGRGVV